MRPDSFSVPSRQKTNIQENNAKNRTALRAGKPFDGFVIMRRALNGETPSVPAIGSLGAAYAISYSLNIVETLHATSLLWFVLGIIREQPARNPPSKSKDDRWGRAPNSLVGHAQREYLIV
jgi:hypothetical protein